jgi:hypothetical protein
MQTEEALVDQLFNFSEKRLARILLLLAHFGDEQQAVEPTIPKISQETLADMVGTYTITRQLLSQQVQKVRLHRVTTAACASAALFSISSCTTNSHDAHETHETHEKSVTGDRLKYSDRACPTLHQFLKSDQFLPDCPIAIHA